MRDRATDMEPIGERGRVVHMNLRQAGTDPPVRVLTVPDDPTVLTDRGGVDGVDIEVIDGVDFEVIEEVDIEVIDDTADATAFEDFYRRNRPGIARGLAFSLGDVDLATEATDEAFVRAYERWSKVAHLDRPEAWIYRVAFNWATSVLRRRRRSPHRLYEPQAITPQFADPAVHASLAALDTKHRSVVVCRHLLGWSVAETAAALGVREGTVKSRLHRAMQCLHADLHHLDPNGDLR